MLKWLSDTVRKCETWLDIGAHYGYAALAMGSLVGNAGRVFVFEPEISTARCVARTVTLNRLTRVAVVPMALGSPATLGVMRTPAIQEDGGEVTTFVASFASGGVSSRGAKGSSLGPVE